MAQRKLAELFIDITMRGAGKVQLVSLRDQIKAMDKSLENNASLYKRQTAAKLDQLDKIAARTQRLANLDQKMYGGGRADKMLARTADADFGMESAQSVKAAATDKASHATFLKNYGTRRQQAMVLRDIQKDQNAKQADELKLLQRTTLERGRGFAVAQLLKGRLASGNTAAMPGATGAGGLGMAAQIAGTAGGPIGMAVAAVAAAITAAIYSGIELAKSASPNAAATYEGSWKMLTNEIGQSLIPALTMLSKTVQDVAGAYRKFKETGVPSALTSGLTTAFSAMWNTSIAGPLSALNDNNMYTSSQHQSRFMSYEEGWRSLQSSAASGGSMEAKLLQQQIEGNQIAAQSARHLATIAARPPGNRP